MAKVSFPGVPDADVLECSEIPSAAEPLSEHVDALERSLAAALKDYRHTAEDALARHLEALERLDASHRLEVSTLRAENEMLREKLGLRNLTDASLFQNIRIQDYVVDSPRKDGRSPQFGGRRSKGTEAIKRSNTAKITISQLDSDCDGQSAKMLNMRRARAAASRAASGGTWQSFVAWVPTGAALRNPEPWKPLPSDTVAPFSSPSGASNNSGSMWGIVPSVGVVPTTPPADSVDDAESRSSSSSQQEKEHFELCDCWQVSQKQLARMRGSAHDNENRSRYSGESLRRSHEPEDHEFHVESPKCYVVHPHSAARIAWDFSSLFLVIYDMIMIPMSVFSLPDNLFLTFMDWTTRLFWTSDMGWSCFTGIVLANGTVQFEIRYIIKQYIKTWFALDVLIVGSDWAEVLFASQGSQMGLGRLARAFRIVRVLRLLRLARMKEIVSAISERIQSDRLAFIIMLLKMQVFVVSISHVMACCWWAIGSPSPDKATWASVADYADKSFQAQYLVSLHWSLSQLQGGMDEVFPVTTFERFYAVFAWMAAFLAASIIVSTLTSNLTQLHIIGGSQSRQMAILRKYLKQNRISSNLALRVQRSAQHAVSGDLTQDAVELLVVVSDPLRIELHFEMYSGILRNHPILSEYTNGKPQAIRRVCHYAMSMLHLAEGDAVFGKGELPPEPQMYFVVKGVLEYSHGWVDPTLVAERQWVAEAALWTRWQHRGTLTATDDAKLAVLDAKTFQDIVVRYKVSGTVDLKLYAADFVDFLNNADEVTDLTSMCARP